LKLAMSLDGRTALANGASQWITGEAAREDVQHWRARSSALLTGVGTVLADDPRLNVRLPGTARQPLRVVLDSSLRTPARAKILDGRDGPVIFTTQDDDVLASALERQGARIERLSAPQMFNLSGVLTRLAQMEVNELLVEAGPTVSGAFMREALVDELLLYVAPLLLGPQGRPLLELPLLTELRAARRFAIIEESRVGGDLRLRLRPA